jgi:succinate dehydrogenase / fumarate reductase cytochrome b subunit
VYQLKEGQLAYIFHRLSGVAIVVFLFTHIVENFFLLMGAEAYNEAISIYNTWYFRIGEFGLIAAVVYHALNGTRIVIVDFWQQSTKYQKQMWYVVMALTILALVWVAKPLLIDYQGWPWLDGGHE